MAKSGKSKRAKALSKSVHQRIGANVKRLREAANVEQQDLAAQLGISAPVLSLHESGKIRIPLDRAIQIAHHLLVPYEQILEQGLPQDFRAGMPQYRYVAKTKTRKTRSDDVVVQFPRARKAAAA